MTRAARRRRARTLRGRVSWLALVVIAGWLAVLAVGFDIVLWTRLDSQVDSSLRVRAQAASATVQLRHGMIVAVRDSATDSELDSSTWVFAGRTALSEPSLPTSTQHAARRLAEGGKGFADAVGRRFYVLPLRADGQRVGSVIAGIDVGPYSQTKRLAILGSAVLTLLLTADAYPVLRFATGRALRPVAAMTRQAAKWSVTSPEQRFGAGQRYTELTSLAATLDELLDRLAAVLRRERQLSAEMSHELRTPLARAAAEVDLALAGPGADHAGGLIAVRRHIEAMDRIIESLLSAARWTAGPPSGHSELRAVLAGPASQHGATRFTVDVGTLSVGVNDAIVERIVSPVLDNAARYAASEIHVQATRGVSGVVILISNDGPLIDGELAERIFEPGFRGDPDSSGGAGLGLPLARRLARAADGDLCLDTASQQTTFKLVLPAG